MVSHNLWLRHNFPKKDIHEPALLIIQYKGIHGKKQCKSVYKVAPIHWDKKAQRIKPDYLELYPDVQNGIDMIKAGFTKQYEKLNKGEVTVQTVFENLTYKRDLSGAVRSFLNKSNNYSRTSLDSYHSKLNGIEKYLGREIKIIELGDKTAVLNIKKALEEASSLGNGAASYMKMLRTIAGNFDFDVKKIYKDAIPKTIEKSVSGFSSSEIKQGINRIQTIAQLEAFLFWLYSFCLKGMTGSDVPNLDFDCLKFENVEIPLNHYHMLGEFIKSDDPSRPTFSAKVHYELNRGKSGVMGKGLYNLFPVLFIKDWLKYCVSVAHPQYLYKGDDPIKIYNFRTKDKKGNPMYEGGAKWKKLKDVYYPMYKKFFGGSLHKTRHSYQTCMERLGFNSFEQKRQISHKVDKEALANYAGVDGVGIKEDLNQISVLNEFDVRKIVKMLCIKFISAKDIENRAYANSKIIVEAVVFNALNEFKTDKLEWSDADERTYQKLLDDLKFKGIQEFDKQSGSFISRQPTEDDFEGRLEVLHNRRKEWTSSTGVSLGNPSKKGGINLKFKVPDWVETRRLRTKDSITTLLNLKEMIENGVMQGDLEWVNHQLDIINSKVIEKSIK